MYCFPHFSHCLIISSSPKWRGFYFCCSYDFAKAEKEISSFRTAMQCCQATTKGTANTADLGNVFWNFNYDQK